MHDNNTKNALVAETTPQKCKLIASLTQKHSNVDNNTWTAMPVGNKPHSQRTVMKTNLMKENENAACCCMSATTKQLFANDEQRTASREQQAEK